MLGGPGRPTAAAFNAGLVLGGLLALPFAGRLRRTRSAFVGGLYALVGLSFAGAGLFPVSTHVALAVWLPYDLGVARAQVGYGFAELVALLAFAVWSVRTAARLSAAARGRTPRPRRSRDDRP